MERTAACVAFLPRRDSLAAIGRPSPRARRTAAGCTIHWFRRDDDTRRRIAPKRIAILDPFEIEQRLLVALAEAQGHAAILCRSVEELRASLANQRPDILFVHIRFSQAISDAGGTDLPLPPVVLIDSCGITGRDQPRLAPIGDFTALRFPIGLCEFEEAVRRTLR
jgi:hypothetical protein